MAKQGRLEGMVPERIKEIQDKALEVKEYQDARLDAQQRETKAREELKDAMKKHGVKIAEVDDNHVAVLEKEPAEEKAFVRKKEKVKKKPDEKDEDKD